MKSLLKVVSVVSDPKLTFTFFLLFYVQSNNLRPLPILLIISLSLILIFVHRVFIVKEKIVDDYLLSSNSNIRKRVITLGSFMVLLGYAIINFEDRTFWILNFVLTVLFIFTTLVLKYKLSAHVFFNGIILIYFILREDNPFYLTIFVLIILLVIGSSRIMLGMHSVQQIILSFVLLCLTLFANVQL